MKLLGLDPGYRRFGIAVATLVPDGARFNLVRVIETEKGEGPVTADMRARMNFIAIELAALCDHDVIAICIEAGSPPFGRTQTSVLTGLGRARGMVDMLAAVMGLPTIEASPQELKRIVSGKTSATKEQVQADLENRFPELRTMWPKRKGDHEHAADAAASIAVGLNSDVVRQAWRAGCDPGPVTRAGRAGRVD